MMTKRERSDCTRLTRSRKSKYIRSLTLSRTLCLSSGRKKNRGCISNPGGSLFRRKESKTSGRGSETGVNPGWFNGRRKSQAQSGVGHHGVRPPTERAEFGKKMWLEKQEKLILDTKITKSNTFNVQKCAYKDICSYVNDKTIITWYKNVPPKAGGLQEFPSTLDHRFYFQGVL